LATSPTGGYPALNKPFGETPAITERRNILKLNAHICSTRNELTIEYKEVGNCSTFAAEDRRRRDGFPMVMEEFIWLC
jgi:hypothetical protein